jgi:hypothetical protein
MTGLCNDWRGCANVVSTICFACGLPVCREHSQKMEWYPKVYKRQPKRICNSCLEESLKVRVTT